MTMKIRAAGAVKTITAAKVRQSGVIRTIRTIKAMDDGILRTVAIFTTPLSASVSPTSVTGATSILKPTTVQTTPASASPIGGTGPYSYSWVRLSYIGGAAPTITAPASATTTFQQVSATNFATYTAVFRVTITDVFGQTATANVSASFYNDETIVHGGTE